ncbi:hypothetical protein BDV29DRAFT_185308 [Aspergillus leporis]|uniref:Uncharacterized protein n=1 Tax=Aspergillus leporis TaxID=41062 RepID=A0A5N5WHN9_9EURO|nr:hypothetical protein BDV29DRAFT_185308 [Aspergillus leporis]
MSESMSLRTIVQKGEFVDKSDNEALHLFQKAFGPELSHLRNAKATVESAGTDSSAWTLSRLLFDHDYIEVNRTLTSTLAIKWLLADKYEAFTSGQPSSEKLSKESFQKLRKFFFDQLPTPCDDIYALIVAMAIDDIGKDQALARELNMPAGKNHSEILLCAVEKGIVPALETVEPEDQRKTIVDSLKIELDISQVMQGETAPCSLLVLKGRGEKAFNLKAMVTFLDVAGASAHGRPRGCAVMMENVFKNYMNTIELLNAYRKGEIQGAEACYNGILGLRAKALEKNGFRIQKNNELVALSCKDPDHRAFLRIVCMGRVESKEGAELFWRAFNKLPGPQKRALVNGLNVNGVGDGVAILPYYAPGILSQTLKNAESSEKDKALIAYMTFLARVFSHYEGQSDKLDGIIEVDLSFAQKVFKDDGFRNNPGVLAELPLP